MKLIGIAVIIISLFFLRLKWDIHKVVDKGTLVEMEIISLPENCDLTRGKYFMDIEYQRKVFNKRIPVGYCKTHRKGEMIKMKFLEGNENILFPTESIQGEFVAIAIFLFVGLSSLLYGFFLKPK